MPTTFCRHIRTNGRRCCSPALRGKVFCYFHLNVNALHRALNAPPPEPAIVHPMQLDRERMQREPLVAQYFAPAPPAPLDFDFPPLEDATSIQVAISVLLSALAHNRIDPRRASAMLYGLQVASSNVRILDPNDRAVTSHMVRELTSDESGHPLALDEDPQEIIATDEFIAELNQSVADEDDDYYKDDAPASANAV